MGRGRVAAPRAAHDAHQRPPTCPRPRGQLFFKQKTAYVIMSGDWSSDVCSSD
eukprot:COSAG04_NODE_23939_length_325_cov_0.372294_1_plen_52_part_10